MAQSVPGTDLRSIKDYEPIPALYDMESVEATGGRASEVSMEEEMMGMEQGMAPGGPGGAPGGEVPPEQQAEIMSLVAQIGPDVAIQALTALAQGIGGGAEPPGGPMGAGAPPSPPGGGMGGPMGALSGLTV
jgi:hypothetical protein